ncbi:acetyl/propionyl/methylcrotonyl-CoA carboxylase subunit alpha [Pseudorhodoferax sp.]|uniref:acetyl/propionyl/methylcrotonyl-CoA carboxylase subunit alpha n=1 Tax=Pseudorhodoferax sp. TaxID=1993553 RepID=UPI002DD64DD9|nr:biotin carboxylase N-terminal domain-containing protein [Pseudorhodoferax sp.]
MTKQIRPFHTLLVANRGEIAVRIFATARRLGYATVAVYSEADRDSPHVAAADRAVCIGAAAPRASYLNIPAILNAARRAGADAIHPGYGFLAENADFADAVDAAGLVFVGPTGAAIRAMGNKGEAKRLVLAADMPCIPGYQGADQCDAAFLNAARDIGYPVMVKATAGGGGRGMRLVPAAEALPAALASARSEALAAFGSDELILERAVIAPRHVEIQLLADAHGHAIHLGERDCSVQRRHQKLIEEAPSPAVDADLRARIGAAAVQAARAIGYIGAGTMEFLLDADQRFYFMEMNTRLQVEHAVTEAITGLDLVEWQLRIASGEALDLQQEDVRLHGHAIEVRLTAEDVPAGFLPQTGPVLRWRPPVGGDVRVDHALAEGGAVSPHYDSMVAKLVAHGATRHEARRKLLRALERCVLLGLPSNQGFLADALADPVFADGLAVHTGFVAERFGAQPAEPPASPRTLAFAALALLALAHPAAGAIVPAPLAGPSTLVLEVDGRPCPVLLAPTAQGWCLSAPELPAQQIAHARWLEPGAVLAAECDGLAETAVCALHEDGTLALFHAGRAHRVVRASPHRGREQAAGGGAVTAPLTGRIVEVAVQVGDPVAAGQRLAVLEAMKMEHQLTAPIAGRVAELLAQAGGQAAKGALLLRIEPEAA